MVWDCERCSAPGGSKRYDSPAEAERYARAFDREDRADLGKRAPLVGPAAAAPLAQLARPLTFALYELVDSAPWRDGWPSRRMPQATSAKAAPWKTSSLGIM